MSNEDDDSFMKIFLIFCSVALVAVGFVYRTLFLRSQENNEREATSNEESAAAALDTDEEANVSLPQRKKYTHALEPKEPQAGDPVYDGFIIGGTASLGVMLWVGASVVLAVSMVRHSSLGSARPEDFRSLGPTGCAIEGSVHYKYFDEQVNVLQAMCVEEWQYNVQVLPSCPYLKADATIPRNSSTACAQQNQATTFFVSPPMTSNKCRGTCDECLRGKRLFGPDYYIGLDPRRPGNNIPSNSSDFLFVECFQSVIVELSDYYDCGQQENTACYLLENLPQFLQQERDQFRVTIAVVSAGYAAGVLLLALVAYFVLRNHQVRIAAETNNDVTIDNEGDAS